MKVFLRVAAVLVTLATPGWRYGNGNKRPGAKLWSVMTVSNIVRQSAYSGVHRVKTNGGKDVIEQSVPAVVEPGLQEKAIAILGENKRYPNRENDRRYLLRGLVRCTTCGGACTGHSSARRGKKYFYYACKAATTYNFGMAPPHRASYVSAEWLEELVWSDVRRFLKDPGEILERLREQHDAADDAEGLEARRNEIAKRLAAKQAEKDRYVRAYAQRHISEEELDVYLAELTRQIDNVRGLLASVEAELSERQEQKSLTDTTHAWLISLGRRLAQVEEDTPEGFEKRKQLVGLLVESISLGRSQQAGRSEVHITYRFGPPPDSASESDDLSMSGLKNGNRS